MDFKELDPTIEEMNMNLTDVNMNYEEFNTSFAELKNVSFVELQNIDLDELSSSFAEFKDLNFGELQNIDLEKLDTSFEELKNASYEEFYNTDLGDFNIMYNGIESPLEFLANHVSNSTVDIFEESVDNIISYENSKSESSENMRTLDDDSSRMTKYIIGEAEKAVRNIVSSKTSKSEFSGSMRAPDESNSNLSYQKYKLIHCTECNKSQNYVRSKRGSLCPKCKTILKYQCGRCMKLYKTNGSLQQHLSLKCDKKPKFFCDHCPYKCNIKNSLSRHIQVMHLPRQPRSYICTKCEKCYLSRTGLHNHSKTCGQSIDSFNLLIYFCDHCGYESSKKSYITNHIKSNHLPRDFRLKKTCKKCSKCGKNYESRSGLAYHLKVCGKPKKPKLYFSCDHCKYMTSKKSCLRNHVHYQHFCSAFNLERCTNCEKCFLSQTELVNHLKLCVTKNAKGFKYFSCDYCKHKTNYKSNFSVHTLKKQNPNKCIKCERSFSRRSNLNRHYKICSQRKI